MTNISIYHQYIRLQGEQLSYKFLMHTYPLIIHFLIRKKKSLGQLMAFFHLFWHSKDLIMFVHPNDVLFLSLSFVPNIIFLYIVSFLCVKFTLVGWWPIKFVRRLILFPWTNVSSGAQMKNRESYFVSILAQNFVSMVFLLLFLQ